MLIADYKTDGVVPQKLDEVPQLRAPAGALSRGAREALSGQTVRAALVFTSGPALMEIPGAIMDAGCGQLGKVVTCRARQGVSRPGEGALTLR